MAVTVDDAKVQLNIPESNTDDEDELALYVAAASEWINLRVSDPDDARWATLVKVATLFLIQHMWESQRGPATTPFAGDEIVTVTGRGYAIPNRVRELLDAIDAAVLSASGSSGPQGSFPDAAVWPDPIEYPVP